MIINNPTSFYEHKRTWTMLKLKKYEDFEAKILEKSKKEVKRGVKRRLKMKVLGGSKVEFFLKNGVSEEVFKYPVGQVLTVKCQGFRENGNPIRPSFFRVFRGGF